MLRKTLVQAGRIIFELGSGRYPQLQHNLKRLGTNRVPALIFAASLSTQVDEESVANSKKIDTVKSTCCGIPKSFGKNEKPIRTYDQGLFGDDACFSIQVNETTHVTGVADGVGGWRKHGVDPSAFSSTLMKLCYEIAESGNFDPSRPDLLMEDAFQTLIVSSNPKPVGSSTACVLIIHKSMLYSANLGDSGFLVWRGDKIVYKSTEQTHYFNAPYQLCLPPEQEGRKGFITDMPKHADLEQIPVQSGDVILLATDGLWDNLPEKTICKLLQLVDPESEGSLQNICNSITLCARQLSLDESHISPFCEKASQQGYGKMTGGKIDDITCLLLIVK
uniref:Protein phosphatase n=1 Tax=Rhabditophanes sp. KR3021 TaxID=114890 RepID=A0AC35TTB3_9BILA